MLHSHSYRQPSRFAGRGGRVMVRVGGRSASGVDISLELAAAGATVYLSSTASGSAFLSGSGCITAVRRCACGLAELTPGGAAILEDGSRVREQVCSVRSVCSVCSVRRPLRFKPPSQTKRALTGSMRL